MDVCESECRENSVDCFELRVILSYLYEYDIVTLGLVSHANYYKRVTLVTTPK